MTETHTHTHTHTHTLTHTYTHTHTENPHGTWGNKEREEGFVHFMTAHSGVGRAEL